MKYLQERYRQLFTTCLLLIGSLVSAQKLPVDASVVINAPYSVYYSDYFSAASNTFQATLIFKDFNEPSHDVRLRLSIESSGLKLQTKDEFRPLSPITLTPGVPVVVSGLDWETYFDLNNLNVSGITKQELATNGRLPEGFYTFCVEVYDYTAQKALSHKSCANVWLKLSDEPVTISPQCGEVVPASLPQNTLFQWQFMNTSSPNSSQTNFKLYVYEITDEEVDPLYALDNGKTLLVFESEELFTTSVLYNIGMPPLELGKKYLYRVQAIDPSGKDLFKNGGYSQNCWFSYGYPTGGEIQLKLPEEEQTLHEDEQHIFSWSSPSKVNTGQSFYYKLRIVEVQSEIPVESQFEINPTWHQEQTIVTTSDKGWELEISKELEAQKTYAWQVKAYTESQEIATSEIRTFKGPSLVDYFMAGQHKVYVDEITSPDLENFGGKGKVKISNDLGDNEFAFVEFANLHLIYAGGRYVLEKGQINHPLKDIETVLDPTNEENTEAYFYPTALKLDKEAMEVQGQVKYPFPHPVNADEVAYITTEEGWVNYDEYVAFGTINLDESNTFELIEPMGFGLEFYTGSEIQLDQGKYTLKLDGQVFLPQQISTFSEERVSFEFIQTEQIYYIEQNAIAFSTDISLVDNTKLAFRARDAIIDFSTTRSPQKFMSDKEWEGVYFPTFEVDYPEDIDASEQLVLEEAITGEYELSLTNDFKAWVTTNGLTTYFHDEFDDGTKGTFNTFPAKMASFSIDVEEGAVTNSHLYGSIQVPVIDKYKDFKFNIPLSNGGFEAGYLEESLEHSEFVFSPYGGENRVDLKIVKATFADNERLDMVLDINIPAINAEMLGVADFKVYGDFYIGFGKRNGAKDLEEQVEGEYDGFTVYIDKIGAQMADGQYTFSYSATMPLGEEIAGDEGAPRINIFSSADIGGNFDVNAGGGGSAQVAKADMPRPEITNASDPQTLKVDSMFIAVTSDIVDVEGYLILTKGHPEWGTSLQGGVNGELKMPGRVALGTNMILGTKDKMKYWYLDAWFIDEVGTGIPVFNMFSVPAFEGKIYRHMAYDGELNNGNRPNFVIDPNVEFGCGLYMQLIDPEGGQKFMSDIGMELVVEKSHFTVSMEGDISLINANRRSPGAMAALKKAAMDAVAEEAASQVMDQIGDIEIDVSLGGGKSLGIKASKTSGELGYKDGEMGFAFTGDMGDVPTAGVKWYDGDKSLEIGGSVDGGGSFAYTEASFDIGIGYYPSQGANFNLGVDDFRFDLAFDPAKRSGDVQVAVDGTAVGLGIDQEEGSGYIEVDVSGNRFYAAAAKSGSAEFEMEYGDIALDLSADVETKGGSFGFEKGDVAVKAEVNGSEGSGALQFAMKDAAFDIQADKSGVASVDVAIQSQSVSLAIDKPNGTGEIEVQSGATRVKAFANKAGSGGFELETGKIALGIEGDKGEGSGKFNFDNGQTAVVIEANRSTKEGVVGVNIAGDSVYLSVSPDTKLLALSIEGVNVTVTQEGNKGEISIDSLQGNDATLTFDPYGEGVELVFNQHRILVGNKRFELATGVDRSLKVNEERVEVIFDGREVYLGADKSITYKDDTYDIGLSTTAVSLAYDENSFSVENDNGAPKINLVKGDRSFTYEDQSATITDADNRITIGGDHYVDLEYDSRTFTVGDKLLRYTDDDKVLALGGDENIAEIRAGPKAVVLSQQKELILEDENRKFLIAADKRIEYSEGDKSIKIGGEQIVSYAQGNQSYSFYKVADKQYGFGVTRDGYNFALETGADKSATLKVEEAEFGSMAITADAQSNVTAEFARGDKEVTLKTGKQGLSISLGDEEESGEDAQAEKLEGAAKGDFNGPQYIGDKITASADGKATGSVDMYYNSKDKHFIANAAIKSTVPPCLEAAMAAEASPETWKIDIGTEDQRVSVYPSCSGFGGGGWFNLRPESVNVGVFAGFRAGGTVDIAVAKISALVEAELGVRAKAQLKPNFAILEAGVWVRVYAGVHVDPFTGGSFTVAEAELSGELMIYFYDDTLVQGKLSGRIKILGIQESFKLQFSENI